MVNGHPRNARKTNVKAANYSSSLHTENVGCGKMYAWDLEKSDVMKQVQMALMVTLATLAVFIKSLHPSLPGGDSGELVVAAQEFGVAHPPGYPLFTLCSMLALRVIPVGSPIWKVNVLSATFGALTGGVIYILIYRLCKSHGAGLLGSSMFSLSRLVWTWSCSAEVFSLNNLLLALLMITAVEFDMANDENKKKISYIGSFLCGLCLSNQHTSVIYIVLLVPWVMLYIWKNRLLSFDLILRLTLVFALGLMPYFYLPVSSILNMARWTWGDQSTLTGFLRHLLRKEYGTWDLLKDHSGQGFIHGLQSYLSHLATDLSMPVSALAALSMWTANQRYKKSRSSVLMLFNMMMFGYISFFCWRANLDISNPLFFKVVERFWMQSDLVLVVLASVSFADVCRVLSQRLSIYGNRLDYLLMMPLIAWQFYRSLPICDNSTNTIVRDFALQTLAVFPNNSIILTKGDLPSNSFRYFHLCEGVRPDLTVIDQEVLTYKWSLPMMRNFYSGIHFPGDFLHVKKGVSNKGEKSFRFLELMDTNYHRPIFACIGVQEYESSWKKGYLLWPYSVCWKIVKKKEKLDVIRWSKSTGHLADHWSYAHNSFELGSWESVANEEMWRAKTSSAMFYLDVALTLPENTNEYLELLVHSYQLLSRAMQKASHVSLTNSSDDVPAYWHRNFAIVCERLLRHPSVVGTGRRDSSLVKSLPDQVALVRLTAHHFRQFLLLDPHDPDYAKIKEAVNTLQTYLNNVEKGGSAR